MRALTFHRIESAMVVSPIREIAGAMDGFSPHLIGKMRMNCPDVHEVVAASVQSSHSLLVVGGAALASARIRAGLRIGTARLPAGSAKQQRRRQQQKQQKQQCSVRGAVEEAQQPGPGSLGGRGCCSSASFGGPGGVW